MSGLAFGKLGLLCTVLILDSGPFESGCGDYKCDLRDIEVFSGVRVGVSLKSKLNGCASYSKMARNL